MTVTLHGDTRTDDWAWLRDRDDPAVLAHLEAENAHTERMTEHTAALQEALFEELRARVQETDVSLPTVKGPWAYYGRTEQGQQYARHYRCPAGSLRPDRTLDPATPPDGEALLLDENLLADGHAYFALGTFAVTLDHSLLAYSVDTEGDEVYELRVRDLRTGSDLPDVVAETSGGAVWSADGTRLFYLVLDDAMRPWQLWRHALGTPTDDDVLVLQEDDERFYLGVESSATDELLFVVAGSQVTSEVRWLRADAPEGAWQLVAPRRQDVEYAVEHHRAVDGSERLFVVTNDGHDDFHLCVAPVEGPGAGDAASWRPATAEWRLPMQTEGVRLDGIDVFRDRLAVFERAEANQRIRVFTIGTDGALGDAYVIAQPDPVHTVWSSGNVEFVTDTLRFGYSSMSTPASVFDHDLVTRASTLRWQQPVFEAVLASDGSRLPLDTSRYVSSREWATAPDGTRVPISVVRHRDTPVDGTAPGVLYGYGSYEISIDPSFSTARLSLLDRGFVFAIAHIRGGGELGRRWYLDGKLQAKRNTFTDFVACAEHLVSAGLVQRDRLVVRGGSAGGMLMGAVTNLRPELFAAVIAEVPFVDVVTTMLDETLPLTAIEWEEWGNPTEAASYACMRSYAPYENVPAATLPRMLVTSGLNDPRVGYWEPTKWVQRLRDRMTGGGPVLLRTELGAGHGGPSGRYDAWRDEAFTLAFALDAVGLGDALRPVREHPRG